MYHYADPLYQMVRKYGVQDIEVRVMQHSGYSAALRAAPRLQDNGRKHQLPPGELMPVFPIHCLPGCPDNWVRDAGAFVVPVIPDIGLWFDWTNNDGYRTAVVPSVKGMNPITGQKLEGCQMEQYRDKCPIHKEPFANGNFCEKCGYKWPMQNYVASPNTLWWDGFAQSDGTVRQFFYTEDVARDIASLAIGKENTMPAFGFAFFLYKKDPPAPVMRPRGIDSGLFGSKAKSFPMIGRMNSGDYTKCAAKIDVSYTNTSSSMSFSHSTLVDERGESIDSACCFLGADDDLIGSNGDFDGPVAAAAAPPPAASAYEEDPRKTAEVISRRGAAPRNVEVSVGAGAVIDQQLVIDKRPLEDYHEKPQAMIRLYFVFEEEFASIVRKGVKSIQGDSKGYLSKMPVG